MGWGWLKPLAKVAAVVGAPFTGGASLGALPAIDAIGQIASGMAGGRASGRADEAQLNNNYDRTRLEGARLNLDAPQMLASNSVRGDLLANMQPVSLSGSGRDLQMHGGLNPTVLSDTSRQLGQGMSRDALLSQMQGPAFTPTPQPKANAFDHILNGVGYAGLAANAVGQFKKPKIQTPPIVAPVSSRVRMPTFG